MSTSIKKNSKNKLFLFYFIAFALSFCAFQFANAQGLVPCGMGNDTNNACTLCHLIIGIYGIINWAKTMLITVAAVGIFISGVMYIISSGDEGMVTKAKGFLKNSILGFVIVLMSWFFVNTIMWVLSAENFGVIDKTNWYTFECSTKTSTHVVTPEGVPKEMTPETQLGGTGKTSKGYQKACPDPQSTTPIDFNKAKSDPAISLDGRCGNSFSFSNSSGVDPKILQAIAQIESSCGKNKGTSPAGACGLMQLKPDTASKLAGRTVTCQELISNDSLSIDLSAKYISQNQSGSCVQGRIERIFAGYNSGYGCKSLTADGKKPALYASQDCPGSMAFECCKNPGELDETISYAWNGIGLYEKLDAPLMGF